MQNVIIPKQDIYAKMTMHSSLIIGRISMLAFIIFLLNGPISLISVNVQMGWFTLDTILSLLFFLQHSGMIRRGLRSRLTNIVPMYFHDAIFSIVSGLTLILVIVLWQPSEVWLIEFHGPLRWLSRGLFFAAVVGIGWGVVILKVFDPFGKRSIQAQLSGRSIPQHPFSIRGPFKFVRHPLYFFVLIMIWSCPDLTADRLLFNLLWSGWIYIGTLLEEKDLLSDFGDDYANYQRNVPMLIPWRRSKRS